MGRKLRHVLIFLLILLKEPDMLEADCDCSPSPPIRNCRCSDLTSIPTGVVKLYLENNGITKIHPGAFSKLPELRTLALSNNQITHIHSATFSKLLKLQNLWMYYNQIRNIQPGSFSKLTQLDFLDLSSNQITNVTSHTFSNLTKLRKLFLSHNKLTYIESGTFSNLHKLEMLHLFNNQISKIEPGAFPDPSRVRGLELHANQLSVLPPSIHGMLSALSYVQIDHNPWQCDCGMVPFRMKMTGSSLFEDQMTCAQPARFQGRKLKDINPEDLICKETTISTLPVGITYPSTSSAGSTSSPNAETQSTNDTKATPTTLPASQLATVSNGSKLLTVTSTVPSHYHWYFTSNTNSSVRPTGNTFGTKAPPISPLTSHKPESSIPHESTFPLPVLIGSICGSLSGIALIGSIILTIRYNRETRHPPSGPNSNVVSTSSNTNASGHDQTGQGLSHGQATQPLDVRNLSRNALIAALRPNPLYTDEGKQPVMTRCHDHQYEDVDTQPDQTWSRDQATTPQSLDASIQSRSELLAALRPNALYQGAKTQGPAYTEITSGRSQATTQSNTNSTATVMTSGIDHQYEDMSTQHDQTGQDQSQATTQSYTNSTATEILSEDPTSTEITIGHDRTGQGQSQSLEVTNLAYNTQLAASQSNPLYADVETPKEPTSTEMTTGHDQTGEGQSQATAQSLEVTNPTYNTQLAASQLNPQYVDVETPKEQHLQR
ncbi:uncharacterized protein [Branchiostoma lanceolatum]|uniref:uncharacterized protein n=1 Tax=Branchiostoma lanceolatum TaxID=7740 RepID=UPI0034573220